MQALSLSQIMGGSRARRAFFLCLSFVIAGLPADNEPDFSAAEASGREASPTFTPSNTFPMVMIPHDDMLVIRGMNDLHPQKVAVIRDVTSSDRLRRDGIKHGFRLKAQEKNLQLLCAYGSDVTKRMWVDEIKIGPLYSVSHFYRDKKESS